MMVLAATVVGSSLGFLTIKMFLGLLGDDEWCRTACAVTSGHVR